MNNLNRDRQSPGEWLIEQDIQAEKALLWVFQPSFAKSFLEDGEVDRIIGLSPDINYGRGAFGPNIDIANTLSHKYTGEGFDLEYGWAIAEDIVNALEPLIDPENNLHQYEYLDHEERDQALNKAFSQLAETSDRLLEDKDATLIYNLESVGRYELPDLAEKPLQNHVEYGERIADHLEEKGFDTEVIEDPSYSRSAHVIGRR